MSEPTHSYLTLHSPRGAYAGFSLGQVGRGGGFSLEEARLPNHDLFIGVRRGAAVRCLPFYQGAASAARESFTQDEEHAFHPSVTVEPFAESEVNRALGWGSDRWDAPGVSFALATPVSGIPDPEKTPASALQDAIAPALAARLTIDNRTGAEAAQGFFAVNGLQGLRMLADETGGELGGIAGIQGYGFAYDGSEVGISSTADFDLLQLFSRPRPQPFRLATMACLLVEVPAGELRTVEFVLGWFKAGVVTAGLHECAYYYNRFFPNLAGVLRYALARREAWWAEADRADRELAESGLNADQQFMLAQATRSYYGSSLFLHQGGRPRWAVNEGSFTMINTFDLAIDHLFFELRFQPWAARSVLDSFADDYSYYDQAVFPGSPRDLRPGGLSFTHDQGIFNTFTPRGYSCYEVSAQPGCFSYMTQEQLTNWVLCAAGYVQAQGDGEWLQRRAAVVRDCLTSLLNRDHPDPAQRDGIMDLDSSRCEGSCEITTYDSLDPSLGQARRNLYLGVKQWAAYVCLEELLKRLGETALAAEARAGAQRAANTIVAAFRTDLGYIPAILDGVDQSPIIPAIEGLIYPFRMGLTEAVREDGPYGAMIRTLKIHLRSVLQPGRCLFPDGGWKLSANSINSWISKVFLCQYVARAVLGMQFGEDGARADRVHADWWRVGSRPNPAIDQIFDGKTSEVGFYYPRAVTSILWLDE